MPALRNSTFTQRTALARICPIPRRWPEDFVPMKRKWLKVFTLLMMGVASGFGAVNPKEILEMIHIMNEQKIEFSIPDDSDDGDGDPNRWWRNYS
jgi:hypothetical protein